MHESPFVCNIKVPIRNWRYSHLTALHILKLDVLASIQQYSTKPPPISIHSSNAMSSSCAMFAFNYDMDRWWVVTVVVVVALLWWLRNHHIRIVLEQWSLWLCLCGVVDVMVQRTPRFHLCEIRYTHSRVIQVREGIECQ